MATKTTRFVKLRDHISTPEFIKKLNGWLTWFWIANVPFVIGAYLWTPEFWQKISILYLAILSVWANIASHAAAWIAGRVEVEQATG